MSVEKSRALLRDQTTVGAVMDSYQANGEPFVYLLKQANAYKIGFSTRISQRVRAFNTAHSKPIQVVAVAPGGRREEMKLHTQFNHCQVAGEWFAVRREIFEAFQALPGVMVFLAGHCQQDPPPTSAAS